MFLIFNPVRAEAADGFETYVRDVLGPAVASHEPEMLDKVELWRASEPEPGDAGIIVYAFLARGVSSWEELELEPAFRSHYGEEEAEKALEQFGKFFADHRAWVESWSSREVDEGEGSQYGWRLERRSMRTT
jgi:hypothetical protein